MCGHSSVKQSSQLVKIDPFGEGNKKTNLNPAKHFVHISGLICSQQEHKSKHIEK